MKKFLMTMTVALLTTAGVMAQNVNESEHKQLTKSEMVQKRTERMAQRYSLTEEQKAKLTELNTKYADIIAMPRGERGRRPQGMNPHKKEHLDKDSVKHREFRKGPRGGDFEKMREKMEAYNTELKGILTDEQYSSFENDRKKMMRRK